jgi:hypothetical protein
VCREVLLFSPSAFKTRVQDPLLHRLQHSLAAEPSFGAVSITLPRVDYTPPQYLFSFNQEDTRFGRKQVVPALLSALDTAAL